MLLTSMALIMLTIGGLPHPKPAGEVAPSSRPNLVFIMSDQHSYDMVGWHKGSQALTPNLTSIAQNGAVLHMPYLLHPNAPPSEEY
jgi:arylsulfatase A-like enzyme